MGEMSRCCVVVRSNLYSVHIASAAVFMRGRGRGRGRGTVDRQTDRQLTEDVGHVLTSTRSSGGKQGYSTLCQSFIHNLDSCGFVLDTVAGRRKDKRLACTGRRMAQSGQSQVSPLPTPNSPALARAQSIPKGTYCR